MTYTQEDIEKSKFDGTLEIKANDIGDEDNEESFYCLINQGKVYLFNSDEDRGIHINTAEYGVLNLTRNNHFAFFWMNSGRA